MSSTSINITTVTHSTKMSVLELHAFPASSPSRAVHMTLDLLKLEYKYIQTNILEGEQKTPEFLAMNPQHTVPVLVDGNLTITESRAAMAYLVSQHKPGQLYPACAKKRSQIDQRLYFNIGTLWKRIGDIVFLASYSSLEACGFVSLEPYKALKTWAQMMKQQIPHYKENCAKGAEVFGNWFNGNYKPAK